ncbi:Lon protease 1 [bacterium HR19]|nr:Lon protease 1 [bacterium HR19]
MIGDEEREEDVNEDNAAGSSGNNAGDEKPPIPLLGPLPTINFRKDLPIPVVNLVGFVIFPGSITPITVANPESQLAIEHAIQSHRFIFASLINEQATNPKDAIRDFGVVGFIMRVAKDGNSIRALVSGIYRAKIEKFVSSIPPFLVNVQIFEDKKPVIFNPTLEAMTRQLLELFEEYVSLLPIKPPPEAIAVLRSVEVPGKIADLIAGSLPLKPSEAQDILETIDQEERIRKLISIIIKEKEILKIQNEISKRVHENIDKAQRIRILQEEIKEMQKELEQLEGVKSEIEELREKAEKLPEQAKKEVLKQIERLNTIPKESPEYTVALTWIEEVLSLPWNEETKDNLDIKRAKEVLDEDHWNLEDVKERILEFLSVAYLKKSISRGTTLCFVGPPGVGKTSLGRSIARALGRKFVRISLGGVRDEAEIRGHRRTYVGAMPGRIIAGIKQAGTKNPVFMLDEIDKIYADFRGDPASALLEVLDPEQNNAFLDHYISVPFDLSKVFFICTANQIDTIPPPLLDRMELIFIPGYTEIDKLNIAKKFFIPRYKEETGLQEYNIKIEDRAIFKVINEYTREAGVRELGRKIQNIFLKIAKKIAVGEISDNKKEIVIDEKKVEELLGPEEFAIFEDTRGEEIGVVTGLAWTPYGGDILKIECNIVPNEKSITLTGNLGEVMKESARAALTYAKVNAKKLGIPEKKFSYGIHIHVPEGAVPKDGPSAGSAIAISLISALSSKPVRQDIAITGEITLRGKILPVGGIREKVLAASRYGVKEVVLPKLNQKDLEKIPDEIKNKIKFHFVDHLDQLVEIVFGRKTSAKENAPKENKNNNLSIGRKRAKQRKK